MEEPPSNARAALAGKEGERKPAGPVAHPTTEPQLRSDELWFFGGFAQRKPMHECAAFLRGRGHPFKGGGHGASVAAPAPSCSGS